MFSSIGYFFLNTWLWGMTWGQYHIPVNILLMLFLLKFIGRFTIISSTLMAVFSKVFSSALYTLLIIFLVFLVKLQYIPPENYIIYKPINVLSACICLGLIYSVFQSLFFVIVNKFYALNIRLVFLIAFVSNIFSALIMYRFLDVN